MRHLGCPFCHIKEVVNVKILSSMLGTPKTHPFSLGNYLETSLIIGNLMRFRITSVDFDLNVDLDSVDVDDVAPPTVKLSDAKRHASLLFSFFLKNSLYFGVNENISFQKLGGNLDKMTIANLGRQHQTSLDSYFKSS